MTLLSFALYRVQHSSYQMVLTSFKVKIGSPTDRSYYRISRVSNGYANMFGLNFVLSIKQVHLQSAINVSPEIGS